jgi:uncharacterized RDD family membrane protein YckC
MQCPRCGISVFAHHSACRDCGWLLAKPYRASDNGQQPLEVAVVEPPEAAAAFPQQPATFDAPAAGRAADSEPRAGSSLLSGRLFPTVSDRLLRRRRRRQRRPAAAIAELTTEAYFAPRPRAIECLEMPVVQTALDFEVAEAEEEEPAAAHRVAALGERARAGLFDAGLILFSATVFFGLFVALGGEPGLARRDLPIYGLAVFALTCLYFCLFTIFAGRTPGMQRYALAAVGFDGAPLTPAQARLRAFGYVVSTGSLLLGYLWALADENQLTWHDHISRTLISYAPPTTPTPAAASK